MAPGTDEKRRVGSESRDDPSTAETVAAEPSDAFQALGNEIRMTILDRLLVQTDADDSSRPTFTELFEATGVDTSAQFAYHLEQLEGPYLRKIEGEGEEPDGYEFTYAGRKIARAIAAGNYTRRVDRQAISLSEPCPFCAREALEATAEDNVVTIACGECERSLLGLDFPPSGFEAHGERLPEAFDRHHRHRLALMRDGVCPECSGRIERRLVSPTKDVDDLLPESMSDHRQAAFECGQCGHEARCPVTLALLEHPDVVSFYRDHDRNVRDRPIWNVGDEWHETVLSAEPPCVRVVVELEGDLLALYVDGAVRVREVQRTDRDAPTPSDRADDRSDPSGEPTAESAPEAATTTTADGTPDPTDAES